YAYDTAGNLTEQVDANGDRLCFWYDSLNRPTHKRHDNDDNGCETNDARLAYHSYYSSGAGKVGQPSEIRWSGSGAENKETFDYNSLGQLTTHTRNIDGRDYTMSYSNFDALGRPTTTTYPNSEIVTVTYDREGANSLTAGSDTLVSDISYNARGQMAQLNRGNSQNTVYSYDTANQSFRLTDIQHGANNSDALPDFAYQYDPVGNITKLTTTVSNGNDVQNFGYDHLNRLLSVSTAYNRSYTYDKLGNFQTMAGVTHDYANWNGACATTPTQAMPHALKQAGSDYFCYDDNGNMSNRIEDGVTYTQNFNVENELTSVTVSGETTSFAYDASGIRVKTERLGQVIHTPFPGYEEEMRTPPTVSLTADGQSSIQIGGGQSFTLDWSSTNAANCDASGQWSGDKAISGSQNMTSPANMGTYTYTLTCENAAASVSDFVTVEVMVPTLNFAANNQTSLEINPNTPFTLSWSSNNVTSCTASGDWSGNKGANGSWPHNGYATGVYTYTLICFGPFNQSVTRSVTVTIQTVTNLTVNGTSSVMVYDGSTIFLQWSSENATSCSASSDWRGSKSLSGSQSIVVTISGRGGITPDVQFQTNVYRLTCVGPDDDDQKSVTVDIQPCPYIWGCESETSQNKPNTPLAAASLPDRTPIDTRPQTNEAQATFVIGNTLFESIWRGNQGWSRAIPIVGGIPDFDNAGSWSGPFGMTNLPGSGNMQTLAAYVIFNGGLAQVMPSGGAAAAGLTSAPSPAQPGPLTQFLIFLDNLAIEVQDSVTGWLRAKSSPTTTELQVAEQPDQKPVIAAKPGLHPEMAQVTEVIMGEVGLINDTLTHSPQTIFLRNSYQNPVVFAQPVSRDGSDTAVIRITDIQANSFTLYVQEAPNKDGSHDGDESVSYVVLEAGVWELANGAHLEVGVHTTTANVGSNIPNQWSAVTFANDFTAAPVVISQVQSNNDPHWVKTRQEPATTSAFNVAMEQEDA
ncbi:MAG: RHS repeat protein, partial [Chloroflexi bacterium]|nr:RHS repeat protein [Chloroflexota bacterium]